MLVLINALKLLSSLEKALGSPQKSFALAHLVFGSHRRNTQIPLLSLIRLLSYFRN